MEPDPRVECSIGALVRYFMKLGALGFGGPIALSADMQRDLVERRRWFTHEEYVEGLALAQLSPGPLAAQLAMYLGWVRAGALGAAVVGLAFVLPSFLLVIAIAALYVRFDGLPWMQGVFYGIAAAVIAIIARSTVKLARTTVAKDVLQWALFAVSAAVTAFTESESIALVIASGVVLMLLRAPPKWPKASAVFPAFLFAGLFGPAKLGTIGRLGWFFTKAGAFVFGSGLAIVPFLYEGVVHQYAWLDDRQFRDAVAVAMVTPGPVVITSGFIGYLVAGLAGAVVAAAGTFVPPYLIVVLAARPLRRGSRNPSVNAFIRGVTAAAIGAIGGAAFVLGKRAIVDVPSAIIGLTAFVVLSRFKKIPEPLVIAVAGVVGLVVRKQLS